LASIIANRRESMTERPALSAERPKDCAMPRFFFDHQENDGVIRKDQEGTASPSVSRTACATFSAQTRQSGRAFGRASGLGLRRPLKARHSSAPPVVFPSS
jgi:hypothetical protein